MINNMNMEKINMNLKKMNMNMDKRTLNNDIFSNMKRDIILPSLVFDL